MFSGFAVKERMRIGRASNPGGAGIKQSLQDGHDTI
jgi:hypothetical protein